MLGLLDEHLPTRDFLAGAGYSVADIALYGYLHVAHEAGYDPPPTVRAWLERVAATPGYMNDLEPYPANARPGAGRSTYDTAGSEPAHATSRSGHNAAGRSS